MGSLFSKPKVELPPPAPPPATQNDNIVAEAKKKKKGDKANLMTGGMGLSGISAQNLYTHMLGGGSNMGSAG